MDLKAEELNNSAVKVEKVQILFGLPFIHCEVKRVEKLNIDDALEQATRDCKEGRIPVVFHRKNKKKWKATLDLDMFMMIYGEYYSSMILSGRDDKWKTN